MKIAVDVRRIRDFGVGTYIRNLLNALARTGTRNDYALISRPEDKAQFSELPDNFRTVLYKRGDASRLDHFTLPHLLHSLRVDLTHIPFHRVPLFMPRPYLVTIHDLGSLFFDDASGALHAARTWRLRRGLEHAERIIAVSSATQRDVVNLVPDVEARLRLIYSAPDPQFLERRLPSDARAAGPDAAARERAPHSRALSDPLSVPLIRRLHPAAEKHPSPD